MKTERLEKLGLKKAANIIKEKRELKRKMTIAYEQFRYVRPEKIEAMNKKLRENTEKEFADRYEYDRLQFISIEEYEQVPPENVLTKVEETIEVGCFDTFEVCKIESVEEVKDPIIFGKIIGCPDLFFVAQWDDDIKIEDILGINEG